MKVVILAGGLGTRLSEETYMKPKPLVEIGDYPILWHIMKIYSAHGINDFIICLGYKGYLIKEFFYNYYIHSSDLTIDLSNNTYEIKNSYSEPWKVTLVDTGLNTMTGGRLKRVARYLSEEKDFCFTYGDGVGDINITELINFHKKHKKIATVTAVSPPGRFGILKIEKSNEVTDFDEKPINGQGFINGGFFVLSTDVLKYISDDSTIFEKEPMELLASKKQLKAYKHLGFWQCMDTQRDKRLLQELWRNNKAPWKIW